MTTSPVAEGPHRSDTENGYVYRFIGVSPEGTPYTVNLEHWFRKHREGDVRWSWGNAGIVAASALGAEQLARLVLQDRFVGVIKPAWEVQVMEEEG